MVRYRIEGHVASFSKAGRKLARNTAQLARNTDREGKEKRQAM